MSYTLRHRDEPKAFEASFAIELPAPHVRIEAGSTMGLFRTSFRRGAAGTEVFVSRKALTSAADGTVITVTPVSRRRYLSFRLLHDPSQRLTLGGLVVALLGVGLDAALAIGKLEVGIPVGGVGLVALQIVSAILKASGLIIVFWKGVLGAPE